MWLQMRPSKVFSLVPNLKVAMLPQIPQSSPLAETVHRRPTVILAYASGHILGNTSFMCLICLLPCHVAPGTQELFISLVTLHLLF